MPGCVPVALVVRTDAIDGAVSDFRPSQIFASRPLSDNVSLGRDKPGPVIEVVPTTEAVVGGSVYVNGSVGGDSRGDG